MSRSEQLLTQAAESHRHGKVAEAESLCRELLRESPTDARALHLLAVVLFGQQRLTEIRSLLKEALVGCPESAELWNDLGVAHWHASDAVQAAACFEKASLLDEMNPHARLNHGHALIACGRDQDGIRMLEALPVETRGVDVELEIAEAQLRLWNLPAAEAGFERVLSREDRRGEAYFGLASTYWNVGDSAGAVTNARLAVERTPDAGMQCRLARMSHYDPELNAAAIAGEHVCAAAAHYPSEPRIRGARNVRGRLRVGYLSGLFGPHRMLLTPLLRCSDAIEVIGFDDGQRYPDRRLIQWVDTRDLSNDQLVTAARDLRIDVLVDCDGYFRGGVRFPVFAKGAAPLQIALPVYPGTTGVRAIDYQISDAALDPPGWEPWHTERLLRIPHAFCFHPDKGIPEPGNLPSSATGAITFGSLSLAAKINERVANCWAAILRSVPESTLLLQHYFDAPGSQGVNPAVRDRFVRLFSSCGVAPERIRLLGSHPYEEHLRVYDLIDIALDPFPYNGTLTTLNALYMGVPVISLAGATNAGRAGSSILHAAGFDDLVAEDHEGYARLAIELARDIVALRRRRAAQRPALVASALMNAERYAKSVEQAFRWAWNVTTSTI